MTRPEHVARSAALFDSIASTYDSVGVDFFGPIAAELLAQLAPTPGERLLDVGCGRGAVLVPAARLVGASGSAVGIDISPEMVRLAGEAARAGGLVNVRVEVADAQDPQVEGPFDVVSASLVLFFLPDPPAALTAWRGLLAPGGRAGVTTFGPMDERWRHVDEVFEPYLPPALRDARTSGARGPFGSDEGVENLLSGAGFVDVRSVRGAIPVRFADVEQWHDFSWSTGQRAMWMAVPPDERPRVRAEAERRLATYAVADGSVTFEQAVRHTLARTPG